MVSDDEIFLCYDQGLVAHGGPEKAKVSWPTWRRFSYYLGKQERYNGKQIIQLGDYFPGQILDRHEVSAVCFVEQSDRVAVNPLSQMDVYRQLSRVARKCTKIGREKCTTLPFRSSHNNSLLFSFGFFF